MNNKELVELLKYSSPNSILVVDWKNKLLELHCPFKIKVKQDIGSLKKGATKEVTKVKLATNYKIVFIVKNEPYFYHYFDILI